MVKSFLESVRWGCPWVAIRWNSHDKGDKCGGRTRRSHRSGRGRSCDSTLRLENLGWYFYPPFFETLILIDGLQQHFIDCQEILPQICQSLRIENPSFSSTTRRRTPQMAPRSPYHRKKICLCEQCYSTDLERGPLGGLLAVLAIMLPFACSVYLVHFRNCRNVGRFRDDCNLLMRFAVSNYRTCVFLGDAVMLHSPISCV
jgi:hypothetical protein